MSAKPTTLSGFQYWQYTLPSTTSYTVSPLDAGKIISSANAGGTMSVTLPSSGINPGFQVGFISVAPNAIQFNTSGGQGIIYPGQPGSFSFYVLGFPYNEMFFTYDGSNWYVTGGGLAASTTFTGSQFTNAPIPVNMSRFDRVLVGSATVNSGDSAPTTADWLTTLLPGTVNGAQFASLSASSGWGVLGGSETASTTGTSDAIGVGGFAFNNSTVANSAWAFYGEAWKVSSTALAPFTTAMELDIVNKSTLVAMDPYGNFFASGNTVAAWLASGGSRSGVGPASAAIGILNNGTTFDKGIVFASTALTSSTGVAIALPSLYEIAWYTGTGTIGVQLSGDTSSRLVLVNSATSNSASIGANGAPPAQVAGYITMVVNGSTVHVPYYN